MTPTIITSVKGRLAHLKQSLPTWLAHTPCEIIVVDVDCPDGSARWAAAQGSRVLTVSMSEPDGLFNKPRALNTGAKLAGDSLLFLDADTLVTPDFWYDLGHLPTYHRFQVVRPSPEMRDLTGVLSVEHRAFDRVGGYDEGMCGWGSEDLDLRLRLRLELGLSPVFLPDGSLIALPHDDALRTRFYSEKDKMVSHQQNLQRLVASAERLSGQSIFALLEDPAIRSLFGRGLGPPP